MRVFVVAALLVVITGMAIGVWPAISVFRAGGMQGLRSTGTSSPGARPRVRFALVTTQIALTLALLGGSALLLRSLWNVVNVPLGFDGERVITLTAGLSQRRYPTVERGPRSSRSCSHAPGRCRVRYRSHERSRRRHRFLGSEREGSKSKAGRSTPTRRGPRSASAR